MIELAEARISRCIRPAALSNHSRSHYVTPPIISLSIRRSNFDFECFWIDVSGDRDDLVDSRGKCMNVDFTLSAHAGSIIVRKTHVNSADLHVAGLGKNVDGKHVRKSAAIDGVAGNSP